MIRYVPNMLSVSRLFFAVGLVWAMIVGEYGIAILLLVVGASTDALDGWAARTFHATSSLGKNILEPICDLVLVGTAIVMMVYIGIWPWWSLAIVAVIAGLFQLIHQFRQVPWIKPLKRHQNYLHPFYAVLVMCVTLMGYIHSFVADSWNTWLMLMLGLVIVVVIISKRGRIREMYHYQED